MSRIESGREIIHSERFSPAEMLEHIKAKAALLCGRKGLDFELFLLNEPDEAYIGDDKKPGEVLLNIISYAAGRAEKPDRISLSAEKTEDLGDRASLRFCVSYIGAETDKENIEKIFDSFSLENNTVPARGVLGTAITKRLVEMMNGTITAAYERGYGTVFTVTLTLLKNNNSEMTALAGGVDPQTLYILVVDDNPIEAEHAGMVLVEAGIRADTCTSGQEALRKLEIQHTRKHPYNIVLTDWNMPGMNGAETSAEILKLYGKESVVAAMTAYSWDDIREEALEVGVENYLEKPLFASTIIEKLTRIARQSNMTVFKGKNRARLEGRRILLAEDVEINV